jgi:ribosomal protein S14
MSTPFDFGTLVELCRNTHAAVQSRVGQLADTSLAVRNWLLGWYVVEYEQKGADRAAYGSGLLERLSEALGKGFSVRSLRQFRAFYLDRKEIRQTASAGSAPSLSLLAGNVLEIRQTLSADLFKSFTLGWSHYVTLLTLDSPDERRFYEIEAAANQWSVRELERQMASSLYQRLALSRSKDEIRRLATQGQVLGQMQMYVNYFDRHVKTADELPTIGIVLCHRKNDALVELTLPKDANIFASKYQLYLPSREELKARLEQITQDLESGVTP